MGSTVQFSALYHLFGSSNSFTMKHQFLLVFLTLVCLAYVNSKPLDGDEFISADLTNYSDTPLDKEIEVLGRKKRSATFSRAGECCCTWDSFGYCDSYGTYCCGG